MGWLSAVEVAVAVTVTCLWKREARVLGTSIRVGRRGVSWADNRGARSCRDGRRERRVRGCRSAGMMSADDRKVGGIAPKE